MPTSESRIRIPLFASLPPGAVDAPGTEFAPGPFGPAEQGAMRRPPHRTDELLITRRLPARIAFVSVRVTAATFAVFPSRRGVASA